MQLITAWLSTTLVIGLAQLTCADLVLQLKAAQAAVLGCESGVLLSCRTYLFPGFLSPDKAEHFVAMAKARLAPSSLAFKKGDTEDNTRCKAHTALADWQFCKSFPIYTVLLQAKTTGCVQDAHCIIMLCFASHWIMAW